MVLFQVEVISDEPGLYMFHDFLSDSEIERLQTSAFMKGVRNQFQDLSKGGPVETQ